jgi:LysM repeat protein
MSGVSLVSANSDAYVVQPGDTLSAIADSHGVFLSALEAANPQIQNPNLIQPGEDVNIPSSGASDQQDGAQIYTVQSGDTLSAIGERFGVDWHVLAQINQLANPNLILPGESLQIPGAGSSASAGTGPSGSSGSAGAAAQDAQSYLGQTSSALEVNTSDKLPMDPSCPSGECCANFVSAVLNQAGLLPANQHTDSVAQLQSTLESDGWTEVPLSQAKPGDVVIMQGGGIDHTEMIASDGQMIGSNNISSDNQQVSYNPLSYAASHGGVVLRPPASTGTSTPSNSGSTSSSGRPVPNSGSAQAILQNTAAQDGWGSGSEWQALSNVENAEAGFNPTAENPSSGALGMAQALGHGDANTAGTLGNQYGGYGLTDAQAKAANSGNAADQALWMVNYIKSTYGTPEAAWAHEQADHWY